jgi:PAS domain S-box-containing protein
MTSINSCLKTFVNYDRLDSHFPSAKTISICIIAGLAPGGLGFWEQLALPWIILLFILSFLIAYIVQRTIWQSLRLREQNASLRESEANFHLLVNSVEDYAIFMLSPDGLIKSWNNGAARIKQYQAEEILGRHFSCFYTPEDQEKGDPANALRIATQTGKYCAEGLRVRKNGERFWANVVIDALHNPQGTLVGFAKITRDITERRQAEQEREALIQQLVNSNGELERFGYVATHDLQEPLRLVCNFSALLQEKLRGIKDPETSQYIDIIASSAKRMYVLIADLLEYARLSSEPERNEMIVATQCLHYVTDLLQIVIQERNSIVTNDSLPVTKGSRVHFSTLLQNLIGNALKYQPPAPHQPVIHVSADLQGNEWVFCVRDNGIGIKQDYLELIFEPFKRLHQKDEYFGNGIGLTICRKIVARMGGRIWAESTPGKGSAFYFTVPTSTADT